MSIVIISGGPGAGKTTLLNALAERGYATYPEIPRQLIEQESLKQDGILLGMICSPLPNFAMTPCWCKSSLRKVRRWRFGSRDSRYLCVLIGRRIGGACQILVSELGLSSTSVDVSTQRHHLSTR